MSSFLSPEAACSEVMQRQGEVVVGEASIDIISSSYADRHVVVITQTEMIGTVVTARPLVGPTGSVQYDVKVVFGKREDPLLLVYGRQVMEKIYLGGSRKPLLLAVALRESGRSAECFQAVLNKLEEIRTW